MDAGQTNLIIDLVASLTVLQPGSSAALVVDAKDIGQGARFGLNWDMDSAQNLNVAFNPQYSNSSTGTFVTPVSLGSTNFFTAAFSVTGTSPSVGVTDVVCPPIRYIQWTITNNGSVPVNLNSISMFAQ